MQSAACRGRTSCRAAIRNVWPGNWAVPWGTPRDGNKFFPGTELRRPSVVEPPGVAITTNDEFVILMKRARRRLRAKSTRNF